MTLPCPSAQTVSKYNSQYHKLFQCVPKDEILMKVYSCALLRDILLQGRLYISRNWLCFYANLFGKDIKVAIPVVSVRLVKKHKTAGLVPNGLAITTDTGQKYVFVSLLSRDSVYDVLRRICTHLQVNGKSLSLKQFMEEPTLSLVMGLRISCDTQWQSGCRCLASRNLCVPPWICFPRPSLTHHQSVILNQVTIIKKYPRSSIKLINTYLLFNIFIVRGH
uniref:GRAM domain containing 2Aa n=1 Tax=Neolamprologus brichardi TaxID=32507 RepID=A0A3Q4N4Z6_NEOBR